MVRAFKVAGHVFCLELDEKSPLWDILDQYNPFVTQQSSDSLFTLRLNQQMEQEHFDCLYDPETEEGETLIRLFAKGEDMWMEMAVSGNRPIVGWLRTDRSFRNAELRILSDSLKDSLFCINNSLMLMFAFSTATLNTLEMHASVIRNGGKGYLFLAPSGTGKSTHSQQWLKCIPGSDLLNDDNPIVRIWPDGRIIVYGSPWSGKTPCYRNIECPAGAFVQIRRSPENRITPLDILEAYALVYSSCSGLKFDSRMADGLHDSIAAAVEAVPCFVLDCRPDEDAARVCAAGVR